MYIFILYIEQNMQLIATDDGFMKPKSAGQVKEFYVIT